MRSADPAPVAEHRQDEIDQARHPTEWLRHADLETRVRTSREVDLRRHVLQQVAARRKEEWKDDDLPRPVAYAGEHRIGQRGRVELHVGDVHAGLGGVLANGDGQRLEVIVRLASATAMVQEHECRGPRGQR